MPGWQNQYLEPQCEIPCLFVLRRFWVLNMVKGNKWIFTKIVTVPGTPAVSDEPMCMVYTKDRIAVSIPTFGVRVWLCISGNAIFGHALNSIH